MTRLSSIELTQISSLVDSLLDLSGVQDVYIASVVLHDGNGDELGYIDVAEGVFVPQ